MKRSKPTDLPVLAAVLIVGFAAVFFLSDRLESTKPQLPAEYQDEDLSLQGSRLKGYSFGFEGLVADWYWMRSLQYIGDKFVKSKEPVISLDDLTPLNPRLLYPLLDNAVTLDPQFLAVYEYGATVLPAIDAGQAILIAEKGIRNNPREWRLYHYLGFIHWKLGNYRKAAEIYEKGSAIEGAAPFMKLMAAKMRSDAGSRDTARQIYRNVYEQAQDSQSKESARLRLLQMDYLDEKEAIEAELAAFRRKTGRCPREWREIIGQLASVALPNGEGLRVDETGAVVDPSDAPYLLADSGGRCEVRLDRERTKIPLK